MAERPDRAGRLCADHLQLHGRRRHGGCAALSRRARWILAPDPGWPVQPAAGFSHAGLFEPATARLGGADRSAGGKSLIRSPEC